MDVGEPAGGKRAQQVQAGRGLGIGLQHPGRVGGARLDRRLEAVDDVALVAGQFDAPHHLGRRAAGLGELPGHAADLDDGDARGIGQDDSHLQHDAERVADVVGRKLGKAFRAIAALKEERLALARQGQGLFQAPRLTGKDQGGILGQLCLDRGQGHGIGIIGHLHPWLAAPGRFRPSLGHGLSPCTADRPAV